jgi:hypothetical protein
MTSSRLKFVLAAAGAAALFTTLAVLASAGAADLISTLARAIHTHAAKADPTQASRSEVASPHAGQIIPSYRRGFLVCAKPVSDCENIDVAE